MFIALAKVLPSLKLCTNTVSNGSVFKVSYNISVDIFHDSTTVDTQVPIGNLLKRRRKG